MITDPCIDLFPETSLTPLVRLEHIAKDFPFPNSNIRLEANSKPATFPVWSAIATASIDPV